MKPNFYSHQPIIIIIAALSIFNIDFVSNYNSNMYNTFSKVDSVFISDNNFNKAIQNPNNSIFTDNLINELFSSEKSVPCQSNFVGPLFFNRNCSPTCKGCIENGSTGQKGEPNCYKWTCNDGFCDPIASGCCIPTYH